jgi:hypothetical protein
MEGLLAAMVRTPVGSLRVVVQFVTSPVLGAGEDLDRELRVSFDARMIVSTSTHLVATGIFASMYTLALLCFANAVGGGGVCNGQRNLRLRAAAHSVLAAHHDG